MVLFSTNGLCSLQKQVSVMSMNLSAKLDELQRGDRHMETTVALCEIRTQLQELTKSVESCQSEVSEVRMNVCFSLYYCYCCIIFLQIVDSIKRFILFCRLNVIW